MAVVGRSAGERASPGRGIAIETLRGALLWLIGFAGAFVFIEPSPYEIVGVVAIVLFAADRPVAARGAGAAGAAAVLLNIGYAHRGRAGERPDQAGDLGAGLGLSGRHRDLLCRDARRQHAAPARAADARLPRGARSSPRSSPSPAISACSAALSDLFLLYDRARGTFNDPNVLGAFLVLPALLVFQRMLAGRAASSAARLHAARHARGAAAVVLARAPGASSRFAALLLMALTFVTSRSARERLRIVAGRDRRRSWSSPCSSRRCCRSSQVAELFKERATLEQSYDVGHYGRFGRYLLGADLALEHPFGIGPLQFSQLFPRGPAQHLSQRLHVRRLARRLRLSRR